MLYMAKYASFIYCVQGYFCPRNLGVSELKLQQEGMLTEGRGGAHGDGRLPAPRAKGVLRALPPSPLTATAHNHGDPDLPGHAVARETGCEEGIKVPAFSRQNRKQRLKSNYFLFSQRGC